MNITEMIDLRISTVKAKMDLLDLKLIEYKKMPKSDSKEVKHCNTLLNSMKSELVALIGMKNLLKDKRLFHDTFSETVDDMIEVIYNEDKSLYSKNDVVIRLEYLNRYHNIVLDEIFK